MKPTIGRLTIERFCSTSIRTAVCLLRGVSPVTQSVSPWYINNSTLSRKRRYFPCNNRRLHKTTLHLLTPQQGNWHQPLFLFFFVFRCQIFLADTQTLGLLSWRYSVHLSDTPQTLLYFCVLSCRRCERGFGLYNDLRWSTGEQVSALSFSSQLVLALIQFRPGRDGRHGWPGWEI